MFGLEKLLRRNAQKQETIEGVKVEQEKEKKENIQDKESSSTSIREKLSTPLKVVTVVILLMLIGTAVLSIEKQKKQNLHFSSTVPKPMKKKERNSQTGKLSRTETVAKASLTPTKNSSVSDSSINKVEKNIRRTDTNISNIRKTQETADVSENNLLAELTEIKRNLYYLKAENKLLDEKIKNLEKKKKISELQKGLTQQKIEIAPPNYVDNLTKQLQLLERKIENLAKNKKDSSIKSEIKKKIEELRAPFMKPKSSQSTTHSYTLVAIVGNEAVIKRDGKEMTVKDGELIDGKRVKVGSFSVYIGNEELSLSFTDKSSPISSLPIPFRGSK